MPSLFLVFMKNACLVCLVTPGRDGVQKSRGRTFHVDRPDFWSSKRGCKQNPWRISQAEFGSQGPKLKVYVTGKGQAQTLTFTQMRGTD